MERCVDYLTRNHLECHYRPRIIKRMLETTKFFGFLIACLAIESTFTGVLAAQDLPTDIEPSLNDPLSEQERAGLEDDFVHPSVIAKDAFGDPKGADRMAKLNLWVDKQKSRVYFDGYVTMRTGPLEMLACQSGTKEHESVVATLPKSSEVHAALLAVGAKPGTPVAFLPRFVPATGQRIRVWICYRDESGQFQVVDARRWIRKGESDEHLEEDWVFGGSGFWKDPRNNREYYEADGGDMICVSNFSTAMMDLPIASSAEASRLMYSPFTERIPERGVPVRIVLVPIPLASDAPNDRPKVDAETPPEESVLPRAVEEGR